MTKFPSVVLVLALCASEASARQAPAFEVGAVVRVDQVQVEGDLAGPMAVAGLSVRQRVRTSLSIEGEITRAHGTLARHYSGWFVSFAPPGSSPAEVERLAPTARRDLRYVPGWGGGAALVWRGALSPRVDMGFKLGVAGRRYVETSAYTILTIPPELDEAQVRAAFIDERHTTNRGGVWFGLDAPIRVMPRLRVIPEARVILGPRQVGNAHREWSVGVRGAFAF